MFVNGMRGEEITLTVTGKVLENHTTTVTVRLANGVTVRIPKDAIIGTTR